MGKANNHFSQDPILTKKWFVKWGQRVVRFSMTPINYTLSLSAMSQEKLEFVLPAVFTIGPKDEPEFLHKYAHLLADTATKRPDHLEELIRGIIEGEMRVIAASLTIEEIFKDRKPVKDSIMHGVQSELDQFGLVIYNANIKQLHDSQGSEYFQYMRLKTHEGAVNQAKVDVAEARYKGDVGEAARKGKTRQENSKIEASTVILENERQAEIAAAQTDLNLKTTDYNLRVKLAQIDADKAAELRGFDLQKAIETKKAAAEEERLRATQLAKAKIDAEGVVAKADAELYKSKREADANLYQRTKVEAEAMVAMADADLYSKQKRADAALYASVKEAEGIKAKFEAQAIGLKAIGGAFEGNSSAMIQYLMMEKGIYQDLAKANAEAVRGLNPKLNIWTTGGSGEGGSSGGAGDPLQAIRNMQSLIPLVSGINEMTGITPPSWLGTLPDKAASASKSQDLNRNVGSAWNGVSPTPVARNASVEVLDLGSGVREIAFNRPAKFNSLNPDTYDAWLAALREAAADPEVLVVILTGRGEYFSTGQELAMPNIEGSLEDYLEVRGKVTHDIVDAMIEFPKILIAAVNGPAFGVACTTLGLCDLVYCTPTATFTTPFMSLALAVEGGSSLTFPRVMGPARANRMLLLGETMSADEWERMGMISSLTQVTAYNRKILPKETFVKDVRDIAHKASKLSPVAVAKSKALIVNQLRDRLKSTNVTELNLVKERMQSDEFIAAVMSFMSKSKKKAKL
ncbi:hypothetical protein HK101_009940 [Irineochytrium annulatum]|nr:hypothetical protein HK101_009940 [Irineochytrium annulatum]